MRAPISPRHTCARARARVYARVGARGGAEERVRVTKGQGKGSVCGVPYWRPHTRMRQPNSPPLRDATHTIRSRTHATRVHLRSVSSAARTSPRPPNLFQVSHFRAFSCSLYVLAMPEEGGRQGGRKRGGWWKEISVFRLGYRGILHSNFLLAPWDYYVYIGFMNMGIFETRFVEIWKRRTMRKIDSLELDR